MESQLRSKSMLVAYTYTKLREKRFREKVIGQTTPHASSTVAASVTIYIPMGTLQSRGSTLAGKMKGRLHSSAIYCCKPHHPQCDCIHLWVAGPPCQQPVHEQTKF